MAFKAYNIFKMIHKKLVAVTAIVVAFVLIGVVGISKQILIKKETKQLYSAIRAKLPLAKTGRMANLVTPTPYPRDFVTLWYADFNSKRVVAINREGEQVWLQHMDSSPIPPSGYATHTEYVTLAPNKNLIVSDGEGMFVQEIDRKTHKLLWQYGHKDIQSASPGYLHQPDKSYKINDHEVLINDGNNRRVIIVDQNTNNIVWQYGETLKMGSGVGLLQAGTNTVPLEGGKQILITDTLAKKVFIVDRATKNIVWEWTKPDASWIQHVFPTKDGTFVMEDRNLNQVFEVDKSGKILWLLTDIGGRKISHPTDTAKLGNGNVLIAEAGRSQITEVNPATGEIVREYKKTGYATTIALDQSVP